jgi:hypothetical protein
MQDTGVTISNTARFVFWLLRHPRPEGGLREVSEAARECPLELGDIEWPIVEAICGTAAPEPQDGTGSAVGAGEGPAYTNPSVIRQIVKHGISEAEARRWFQEMLKFLTVTDALITEHGDYWPKSPPPRVDVAWHEFILHTEDYAGYCDKTFGRFVEHHPAPAPDDADAKVNSAVHYTRVLLEARKRYGPLDREIWPSVSVTADGHVLSTGQL